jgi:hypothetical protein
MEYVMKSQSTAASKPQRGDEGLDGRYGKIGISAVAAALQYPTDAKNQAYAPAIPREDYRYAEASVA